MTSHRHELLAQMLRLDLDCSSADDLRYSAGVALRGAAALAHALGVVFADIDSADRAPFAENPSAASAAAHGVALLVELGLAAASDAIDTGAAVARARDAKRDAALQPEGSA